MHILKHTFTNWCETCIKIHSNWTIGTIGRICSFPRKVTSPPIWHKIHIIKIYKFTIFTNTSITGIWFKTWQWGLCFVVKAQRQKTSLKCFLISDSLCGLQAKTVIYSTLTLSLRRACGPSLVESSVRLWCLKELSRKTFHVKYLWI